MDSIIELKKEHFLAKGGERNCYLHPFYNNQVIKVVHRKVTHNEQNKLEYIYINYLKEKKIPFSHIVDCYGFVKTNKGEGLIFQRVLNYDGNPAKSFKVYLENKIFSKDVEFSLINELKKYLFNNDILFIDVDLSNVFCQEFEKGRFKLMIIDGIGARRLNWRFYLYLKSILFTRYKIKKQWKKFCSNCKKYTKHRNLFNE